MAEWIINVEKELQGLEEDSEADIHLDLLSATLKKTPNWILVLKIPLRP